MWTIRINSTNTDSVSVIAVWNRGQEDEFSYTGNVAFGQEAQFADAAKAALAARNTSLSALMAQLSV